MRYALIAFVFLAVLLYDYLGVLKGRKDRVFWVYTALLLVSLSIYLMQEIGVRWLNPTRPILYLINDILKLG